jgi:hypothetical protein
MVRAVGSLDPQQQTAMRDVLHRVLTTLAASGTQKSDELPPPHWLFPAPDWRC